MKEFIDKLISRLEEEHERCINRYGIVGGNLPASEVKQCMEIINQLAEEYKPTTNSNIQEVIDNLEVYTVGRLKNARVHITVEELQNQIDRLEQLAEEYNNDFCEWKGFDNSLDENTVDWVYETTCGKYIGENHTSNAFQFCPYCGKKIKVAPYQPKGE